MAVHACGGAACAARLAKPTAPPRTPGLLSNASDFECAVHRHALTCDEARGIGAQPDGHVANDLRLANASVSGVPDEVQKVPQSSASRYRQGWVFNALQLRTQLQIDGWPGDLDALLLKSQRRLPFRGLPLPDMDLFEGLRQ